jgi:hypothetical protein
LGADCSPAACPAGQLAGRFGGAAHDLADVAVRYREDVVQHECQPLGWGQAFQHDQQRQADGLGDHGLVLWALGGGLGDERFGEPRAGLVFPAGPARLEHVQADPPDYGGQPGAQVIDRAGVHAAEAEPGLLDRVFCFGDRAEHAVGDRGQVRAQPLELAREPVWLPHRPTAWFLCAVHESMTTRPGET